MNDYTKIARDFAKVDLTGTVLIPYRELPKIISRYSHGSRAIDFGCGTGASTRFLEGLNFEVTGLDISPQQLDVARKADPGGDYRLIERDASRLPVDNADLVLSAFVFLEMASRDEMIVSAKAIYKSLRPDGVLIVLVTDEDFYRGDWLTVDAGFPENANAKSGDKVRVRFRDIDLTLHDYFWTDKDYTAVFMAAGFRTVDRFYPLGLDEDGLPWKDEWTTAPYVIYVVRKSSEAS